MKYKLFKLIIPLLLFIFSLSIVSNAGFIDKNGKKYLYIDNEKRFAKNEWKLLYFEPADSFLYFYFNDYGVMLTNTMTPDKCYVNESGAYCKNGEMVLYDSNGNIKYEKPPEISVYTGLNKSLTRNLLLGQIRFEDLPEQNSGGFKSYGNFRYFYNDMEGTPHYLKDSWQLVNDTNNNCYYYYYFDNNGAMLTSTQIDNEHILNDSGVYSNINGVGIKYDSNGNLLSETTEDIYETLERYDEPGVGFLRIPKQSFLYRSQLTNDVYKKETELTPVADKDKIEETENYQNKSQVIYSGTTVEQEAQTYGATLTTSNNQNSSYISLITKYNKAEFVEEAVVWGNHSWQNPLCFKGNESYIVLNSKNTNYISFDVAHTKYTYREAEEDDTYCTLKVYADNNLVGEAEEFDYNEPEHYEAYFEEGTKEIKLVATVGGETENRKIYIKNLKLRKKKVEDE